MIIAFRSRCALLSAAFSGALTLAAGTSAGAADAATGASADILSSITDPEALEAGGRASCVEPWQDAPVLLAAASLPAAGTAPEPPTNPIASFKSKEAAGLTGNIDFNAQHAEWDADQTHARLSGDVDVRLGDRDMQADRVDYDRDTGAISASGHIHFSDPTVQLQGTTGNYSDAGSQFNNAQFQFLQHAGRGSAEQISMTPNNVVTLRRVTYTSCPPPRADWDIRARELKLDSNADRGVARGAVVDFKGVPILYLPWIAFPLSDARQSGFLFPTFGSTSNSGAMLAEPWYWNIAPNQDATFTPTIYSSRGLDLGVEYRQLSASNRGVINVDFLPHDQQTGTERNLVRVVDRYDLPDNTRVDTNFENVSDTAYFEDFGQGTQATSTSFLEHSLEVSHRDDIWNLQGQFLGFQTLTPSILTHEEYPYIELPRLSAAAQWSPDSARMVQLGLDSELVNFDRVVGVTGWRLDAKPQIGLDLSAPGFFFRPNVAWEFTQYALQNRQYGYTVTNAQGTVQTVPYAANPSRSLPIIDVDTGLQFERLSGSHGSTDVTLEPRVMYVYIPYVNQNGLPVFDTSIPDPNLIELFRPNRYVGIDRIGDTNALTAGLTTELFDSGNGKRYLSATVGQELYFSQPRVLLPDEIGNSRNTSSLIGELTISAYKDWNLQLDVASNQAVTRIEQAEVTLQYLASGQKVVNIGYTYQNGQLQQVDDSIAWPISSHWDGYARVVYSLLGNDSIQDFVGFQYRGNCWSIRTVAQRSLSTHTRQYDTGVSVQLELTGLSNVGSQVNTFLEQSIRGYSASTSKQ